ncbi:MAG: hypothetical protein Phog2KO_19360 [Phototrophicaceae bacterium]
MAYVSSTGHIQVLVLVEQSSTPLFLTIEFFHKGQCVDFGLQWMLGVHFVFAYKLGVVERAPPHILK